MVVSASKAAEKYRKGIESFGGASQYQTCGEKKERGFLAVAKCLEDAKEEALTTSNMVDKYKAAA